MFISKLFDLKILEIILKLTVKNTWGKHLEVYENRSFTLISEVNKIRQPPGSG
jgi:hypothetical protein